LTRDPGATAFGVPQQKTVEFKFEPHSAIKIEVKQKILGDKK